MKNNDLLDFIDGNTKYLRCEMSLSRQPTNGKKDYFILKIGDKTLTTFWGEIGKEPPEEPEEDSPKKKTMGGKKAYTMLMNARMSEMVRRGEATPEQIGYMAVLTQYIEWGTGRLIKKRSKKSVGGKDIEEALNISSSTWDRKFKGLKDAGLMSLNGDSYYISTDLFKKGGATK